MDWGAQRRQLAKLPSRQSSAKLPAGSLHATAHIFDLSFLRLQHHRARFMCRGASAKSNHWRCYACFLDALGFWTGNPTDQSPQSSAAQLSEATTPTRWQSFQHYLDSSSHRYFRVATIKELALCGWTPHSLRSTWVRHGPPPSRSQDDGGRRSRGDLAVLVQSRPYGHVWRKCPLKHHASCFEADRMLPCFRCEI